MSLDSFNLEQLQVEVYMDWLMFFFFLFFYYTVNSMRARAGPVPRSTVPGKEFMPVYRETNDCGMSSPSGLLMYVTSWFFSFTFSQHYWSTYCMPGLVLGL